MGVRLGEVIDQDMITVAVSGAQRQGAFAALAYIELLGAALAASSTLRRESATLSQIAETRK